MSWAEDSVKTHDEIVRHAIELDEAESRRLDRAIETDARQVPRAQWGTIALNGALIAGAIISAVLGREASAAAFIGGLAVINAMTLFVDARRSRERGESAPRADENGKDDQPKSAA